MMSNDAKANSSMSVTIASWNTWGRSAMLHRTEGLAADAW